MRENSFPPDFSETKRLISPIQYNLVKLLKKNGSLTRRELVKRLNKPRTTIFDNLIKLHNRKIVEKLTRNSGKIGRPKVYWKLSQ